MKPSEAAARLRAAETDAQRKRARKELAGAIRSVALPVVGRKLPPDDAVDVAHSVVLEALEKIERGDGGATNPDAYVRRMASSRAIDYIRREKTRKQREQESGDPSTGPAPFAGGAPPPLWADPEALLLDREKRRKMALETKRLRALLDEAPHAYRYVLEQHYLHEVPLADLAEQEYEARVRKRQVNPADPADAARHRKKARDSLDARLSRARNWLRRRLLSIGQQEDA